MYANPRPPQLSHSNRRIIDSNSETLRLYQVWKGTNVRLNHIHFFFKLTIQFQMFVNYYFGSLF